MQRRCGYLFRSLGEVEKELEAKQSREERKAEVNSSSESPSSPSASRMFRIQDLGVPVTTVERTAFLSSLVDLANEQYQEHKRETHNVGWEVEQLGSVPVHLVYSSMHILLRSTFVLQGELNEAPYRMSS